MRKKNFTEKVILFTSYYAPAKPEDYSFFYQVKI